MIVSGDDPTQGSRSRRRAADLTINPPPASAKRSRLAHLFDLDERHLIDLAVALEFEPFQGIKP